MKMHPLRGIRPIVLYVLLLGVVSPLGACGAPTRPAVATGTLAGDVVASPTCPVEQANNPCPPRPVTGRQVTIEDAAGNSVATTSTDGNGHFSLGLAPGDYVARVAIVPGAVGVRQVTSGHVTITAGQTTNVTIVLDTGIR